MIHVTNQEGTGGYLLSLRAALWLKDRGEWPLKDDGVEYREQWEWDELTQSTMREFFGGPLDGTEMRVRDRSGGLMHPMPIVEPDIKYSELLHRPVKGEQHHYRRSITDRTHFEYKGKT